MSDQALLNTQLALVQALLHPMREFINEHEQEPETACAEDTAALQDVSPGEVSDAVLKARRRVVPVAY